MEQHVRPEHNGGLMKQQPDGAPGHGGGTDEAPVRPARPDLLPADDPHRRPDGVDDATVAAVGKCSEGLEYVERARGHLYTFHQLIGRADIVLGEAADELDDAGHAQQAGLLQKEIVGRNVLDGRWTFQIVEEFDAVYYEPLRAAERDVRDELMDGRRHVFESELKEQRRTRAAHAHQARPPRWAGTEEDVDDMSAGRTSGRT